MFSKVALIKGVICDGRGPHQITNPSLIASNFRSQAPFLPFQKSPTRELPTKRKREKKIREKGERKRGRSGLWGEGIEELEATIKHPKPSQDQNQARKERGKNPKNPRV